jgi:hypothetical protein
VPRNDDWLPGLPGNAGADGVAGTHDATGPCGPGRLIARADAKAPARIACGGFGTVALDWTGPTSSRQGCGSVRVWSWFDTVLRSDLNAPRTSGMPPTSVIGFL